MLTTARLLQLRVNNPVLCARTVNVQTAHAAQVAAATVAVAAHVVQVVLAKANRV